MATKRFVLLVAILPSVAFTQTHTGSHNTTLSVYAGEETRLIKSLSEQNLRSGFTTTR